MLLGEDPLVAKRVIVAKSRLSRPASAGAADCPFCPGREFDTPPAKLVYVVEGGVVREASDPEGGRMRGWVVRCFDNLYPIVTPSQGGGHEVVVETPLHEEQPHRARAGQLALALRAVVSRAGAMYAEGARYVAVFRNYGREAGASIAHPHTQLVALPFVPAPLLRELEAFKGGCPLCRGVGSVFLEEGGYRAEVPRAPLQSYEFRLYPVEHGPSLLGLGEHEIEGLARALRRALGALVAALGDVPYNLWVHAAPPTGGWEGFHWHVEVRPRLSIHAGLELGFEVFVCPREPEEAAEELRAASAKLNSA